MSLLLSELEHNAVLCSFFVIKMVELKRYFGINNGDINNMLDKNKQIWFLVLKELAWLH